MYIVNITKAIKTMSINEMKDFIFENYYKRIGCSKKISYNSMKYLTKNNLLSPTNKLIKNIPDPRIAKQHYESFFNKEKHEISKAIRNNYLSTKNFSKHKYC